MSDKLPASVIIHTPGGHEVILAESREVAKALADEGKLAITPEGAKVLAAINELLPGSRVVSVRSLGKPAYSN